MVATNGVITTVAGTNGSGYSGDGGAATNARLYLPYGVAVDAIGNVYIADTYNQRIRKVATNGIITTVAGTNGSGYSGDGGAATNARLYYPYGVAVDGLGNLFIADSSNERVRKVATNGVITTVAGTGSAGYNGDGVPSAAASLDYPRGVAVDASGDIFIADTYNQRIRKVDTNGIIATVAGKSGLGYSGDGGAATNANLDYPFGVAVDSSGNLYVADTDNQRIRKVPLVWGPTFTINNVSPANDGNYTVVVTSPYGSVTSAVVTLTVLYPPSIVVQPISQGVLNGSNATLGVTAAGTPPLYFSWYDDATNLVQSGTNSTLDLLCVSTNNAGNYTVIVTNAYGSVTSAVAALTVLVPPSVANPAASLMLCAGSNLNFSVAVGGTGPFSYQWRCNGTNLPGATGATLNLTNAQTCNAGVYTVLISGPGGVTSASTLLTVGTTLGVCQNDQQLILDWTGPWALQSATNANGPYADIAGAAAPFTNLMTTGPEQFFRLRSTAGNVVAAIGSSSAGFVVGASGVPGYNYAIEVSTNLSNWTAIQTNPVPFQFIDVNASNYPVRFYRTVMVQ
jgi:sugar lactone lactonase YvrE